MKDFITILSKMIKFHRACAQLSSVLSPVLLSPALCLVPKLWHAISFHLKHLTVSGLEHSETPTSRIRAQPVIQPGEIRQIRGSPDWSNVYIRNTPSDCTNTRRTKVYFCSNEAQRGGVSVPERDTAERKPRNRRGKNKPGCRKVNSHALITLGLAHIGLSILFFNEYQTRINNIIPHRWRWN